MITVTELATFSPFDHFDSAQLNQLLQSARLKQCKAGDTLVGRGERDSSRHYLIEGSAELKASFFERTIIDTSHQALEELTPIGSQMIANTSCKLLCLQAQTIERFRRQNTQNDQYKTTDNDSKYRFEEPKIDWMSRFLESALVQQLGAGSIGKLFSIFTDIEIEAGESIFNAGDEADAFYIIKRGRAEVRTMSYSGDKGSIIPLIAGDYFGEEALLSGTVRNASIFMPGGGTVGRMSREDFVDTLKPAMIQRLEDDSEITFGPNSGNVLLDPRLFLEYQQGHHHHSINIPIAQLRQKLPAFASEISYYVIAEGDERSELATYMLRHAGFNSYLMPAAT